MKGILFILLAVGQSFVLLNAINDTEHCQLSTLTNVVEMAVCNVEYGVLQFKNREVLQKAACYIGKGRCSKVFPPPLPHTVPPSEPPPAARNKRYQELATIAEKSVPDTWWRKGFADEKLLLSHNNNELPTKLFESHSFSNKKLKNIYQCTTRQQFIRKSYNFDNAVSAKNVFSEYVIQNFYEKWKNSVYFCNNRNCKDILTDRIFQLEFLDSGLVQSASAVLDYFYVEYGGIWTGCFGIESLPEYRGAFAAASLVISFDILFSIASGNFTEGELARGYILSSLGRSLLHGDSSNSGHTPATSWKLRLVDLAGLQSAFLKLYIDSIGAVYTKQLNNHIPFSFSPGFKVQGKKEWKNYSKLLEPVYTSVRNWMFTECSNLIDFGPYLPLVAFQHVRNIVLSTKKRRILIDIGANGFFASPKYLLDSYSVYLPFTDLIMVEPEPHFSATIPSVYSARYNITILPIYAEVGTGSDSDMLKLLPQLVSKDDFVVLKFDVDPNRFAFGPTMEWGFLFELTSKPEIASLVDEIYIELHFHFPALYWQHYHSNWEALDVFRYLRDEGIIVHSWP